MRSSGVVGLDPLFQGEVPTSEHFNADAELTCGCAGPLDSALGAGRQSLEVFNGRSTASTGVIVGVLGMGRHDSDEGVGSDVMVAQHPATTENCGG